MNKKYNFIEICAGAGGLSTGLIKAGFFPLLLNDNNKDCCKTLKKNHPNCEIVESCLSLINYSKYTDKVDLLASGLPCQPFSQAGQRKGLEDPQDGDLFFEFNKILNIIKPKVFLLENVKGLLNHNKGNTFKKILEILTLNNLYNITYKCLNSSHFNIPQKRERVFIIGFLKSKNYFFSFPEKNNTNKKLKDVLIYVPFLNGMKYSDKKFFI